MWSCREGVHAGAAPRRMLSALPLAQSGTLCKFTKGGTCEPLAAPVSVWGQLSAQPPSSPADAPPCPSRSTFYHQQLDTGCKGLEGVFKSRRGQSSKGVPCGAFCASSKGCRDSVMGSALCWPGLGGLGTPAYGSLPPGAVPSLPLCRPLGWPSIQSSTSPQGCGRATCLLGTKPTCLSY